jgi:hypothetical protein
MSKTSRQSTKPLEVTIMFEPYRLQHELLQTAYALLVPSPRRKCLAAAQPSPVPAHIQPPEGGERSVS